MKDELQIPPSRINTIQCFVFTIYSLNEMGVYKLSCIY